MRSTTSIRVWEPFGLELGFTSDGYVLMGCACCGFGAHARGVDAVACRQALRDVLAHVEECPAQQLRVVWGRTTPFSGPGPVEVELLDGDRFRPIYAPPQAAS